MYLQTDVDDSRTMNFSIVQPTSKVTAIEVVLLCDRSSGEKLASYVVNRTFQIFLSFQIFLAARIVGGPFGMKKKKSKSPPFFIF